MTTVQFINPIDLLCCPAVKDEGIDETDERLLDAILQASEIVYNLTGRQFLGTQTTTVRPRVPCCCSSRKCSCDSNRIHLGVWPITALTRVWYDGAEHPIEEFNVQNGRYLVREDGTEFPTLRNNNMWATAGDDYDTEEDGYVFEVTVEYGVAAPALIKRATRDMACKLFAECMCSSDGCDLPDRVTSVSRQGVSFTMVDPLDIVRGNGTGIYSVDLAVKTFNPRAIQSPSFFWTPNLTGVGYRVGD